MEFAIDVILHQQQSLLRHLLTIAVDQLDAVVIIRIMAGRDHDAAVKVIHTSNVSHGRDSCDMEQIGICTRSSQTSHQTVLEHIGATTSIFADDDTSRVG